RACRAWCRAHVWRCSSVQKGKQAKPRDLALLSRRHLQLGVGIVLHALPQRMEYLVRAAAAGRDEEDVSEARFIPAILGRQGGERRGRGLPDSALLALRGRGGVPAALSDPG